MARLPSTFTDTRLAVHTLAEHVLCAARYAAVGRIGLTPVADGVVTPAFDGRVVGVRGVELVDVTATGERRRFVTTLRAAGTFLGVAPGAPPLWTPTTSADPDVPLRIDAASVGALAAWFGAAGAALAAVFPDAEQTLWPEHFDLAVSVGGATYGGSPGDESHAEPYLYVVAPDGTAVRRDDGFWNEPFGASLGFDRVADAAAAGAFFADAVARLAAVSEVVRS